MRLYLVNSVYVDIQQYPPKYEKITLEYPKVSMSITVIFNKSVTLVFKKEHPFDEENYNNMEKIIIMI